MTATAAAIDRPLVVHKRRTPRRRVALYAFLTLMAVTWLFPLLWAAYTALRPISDTLRDGYISLPTTLNLDNFVNAFNQANFTRVSTAVNSGAFGRIRRAADGRVIQFGLKLRW